MEWEHGTQHTKSDEGEREEHVLHINRHIQTQILGYLLHFKSVRLARGSRVEVDAEHSDHQEGGTSHQHQGQLHGCIFLRAGTPMANQQIHWYQCHLVEEHHGEEVDGNEESEHTD